MILTILIVTSENYFIRELITICVKLFRFTDIPIHCL